jgi:hypothetical protein
MTLKISPQRAQRAQRKNGEGSLLTEFKDSKYESSPD